jgi:TonB-dependent starch-binding outer membrane protein SusC
MYKNITAFPCGIGFCIFFKIVVIMKLAILLLLVSFFSISAKNIYAQNVSVQLKRADITDVFKDMMRKTSYEFLYDKNDFKDIPKTDFDIINQPVQAALATVLKGLPFDYKIDDNVIVIKKRRSRSTSQDVEITGQITDQSGEAQEGVTIVLKNTQKRTASDRSGNYRLRVPGTGAVLVFSLLGFERQEIAVNGNTQVNVRLKPVISMLNETVIIGYGEVKRSDLTGSVGQVAMEDFAKAPVPSLEGALAGRVAGVTVSSRDGQPGALSNIVIRGAGSITQDNSPLYIIDGFPIENPDNNVFNPSDVASIDVLKDASATAIYGARGANGVIIITTKSGQKGAPIIAYNLNIGSQRNTQYSKMMDPYEFVRYQLEVDPGRSHIYVDSTRSIDYYKADKGSDFQRELFRTGLFQSHDLSLRGGNDRTIYSLSGNFMDQDGIIVNTGFKRSQGRVNIDQQVNEKLKVVVNANYSETKAHGAVFAEHPAGHTNSYIYNVLGFRPTQGLTSGNLLEDFFDIIDENQNTSEVLINPITSIKNEHRVNLYNNLLANGYLQYRIQPYLTLKISGGLNRGRSTTENFNNSQTSQGNIYRSSGVNGRVSNYISNGWLNENTLSFSKVIGNKHKLDVLGGITMQGNRVLNEGLSADHVPNEELGVDGLDEAPNVTFSRFSSEWALVSFLARVNYDFNSKYLFTFSMRADGSSKFAPGNRWAYFPSGAFAWRLKNENFFKDIKSISESKLRLSYGHSGNNRVSDFPYLSSLSFPVVSGYSFNNGSPIRGIALGSLGSDKLKWETSVQVNVGYDLGLLNNRIMFTAEMYRKTTRNLLLNAEVPYVTGYITSYKNIGKMQNEGLELTLNTINIRTPDFTWSSNFNIAFNRNEVLALTENQMEIQSRVSFAGSYSNIPLYVAQVGQPLAQFYGLVWDGVYQYSDFNQNEKGIYVLKDDLPTNGNPRNQIQPGDIRYKDLTGDGMVNSSDFTVLGRAIPKHVGGFSNNFTYGNFDLNIFFQWSYGNKILNGNRLIFEGNGTYTKQINQYANYAERWTPDNPSNTLFRVGGQGPMSYSTRVLEDGSYLRLKTVSFGYNLSNDLLRKLRLKSLRLSVAAQDLFTWTNYSGGDPEVSTRNSNLTPGFDYSAYPRARTLTVGLNTSF